MILFNLKLVFRNLLKNKLYSILIIGGFAIGFTACILIGLFYNSEHNVNKGFSNYKNIYRLYDDEGENCHLDYDIFPLLAADYPEVELACPIDYHGGFEFILIDVQEHVNTRVDNIISTNNNFFTLFKPRIISSLASEPFSGNESVVITESVAKQMYGDKDPVGSIINIFNMFNATITAVIEDLPENSTFKTQVILNSENEAIFMPQESHIFGYLRTHIIAP